MRARLDRRRSAAAGLAVAIAVVSLAGRPASAQDFTGTINDTVIEVTAGAQIASVNTAATVLYFVDDAFQVVQLHCETVLVKPFIINVGPCRDAPGQVGAVVDFVRGGGRVPPVPPGKKRNYRLTLKNVLLVGGSPKDVDLTATADASPMLRVQTDAEPFANRRRLTIVPIQVNAPADSLAAILKAPDKIAITYEFAKDDPEPPVKVRAAAVRLTPAKTALIVTPSVALPRRPKKYSVKVEVPVGSSGVPLAEFPPDATALAGAATVELPPAAIDRATSAFFFEVAYASSVTAATGLRTNVGVFALHLKPAFAVISSKVDGTDDGSSRWWAFRPLLDADVDTRSPAESKVSNRILLGLDYDLGWDTGNRAADRLTQQVIVTNGAHYESDRDFDFQSAFWHVELKPVFKNWEQVRERRQFLFSQWLATQDPKTTTRRQPRVSSYYVRPSLAYDIGGVVRDKNGIHPYDDDAINRMPWRLDAGIEFLRTLVFAITHDYHVIWNVDEDKGRSYVEARVELNTGTLFRLDRNSLQHAVTFKYQRGEQAPTFKPVDTLSVGVRLFR